MGDLGRAGFANDRDPDLAGVSELVLDLFGDLTSDHRRAEIIDDTRLDHHPDLASGLHGEHPVDALARTCDLLDTGKLYVAHYAGLDNATGNTLLATKLAPTEAAPGTGSWIELDVSKSANEAELRNLATDSYRHFANKRMLKQLESSRTKRTS